jgi:ribosomal protein S18 acetylase RimI-like enzyme
MDPAPDTGQDVTVRPLHADDVDAAMAMFAAVVDEGIWLGTEPGFDRAVRRARWLTAIDDPTQLALVAVGPDGEIVGNASASCAPYGVADLGMAVADGWRGRGVGAALLDRLVEAAPGLGAHKVALEVWPHNVAAIGLYRSRGFEVEGRRRRHYRRADGELWDAILMGLVLDTSSPGSALDEG